MTRLLKSTWHRLYNDFFMPCRLAQYRAFLRAALEAEYEFHSVVSFFRENQECTPKRSRRVILRHDVDSDVKTAEAMWEIEQELGVRASFYFRLSTVDIRLMQSIEKSGSEASYHFEELATVAKRLRIRDTARSAELLPLAAEEFVSNLRKLRMLTGLPMYTVASHGDFANRVLKAPNYLLLADQALRARLGILAETYDAEAMRQVVVRCADAPYPELWIPEDPRLACDRRVPVLYVLTHPGYWRASWGPNISFIFRRIVEGIAFKYGSMAAH